MSRSSEKENAFRSQIVTAQQMENWIDAAQVELRFKRAAKYFLTPLFAGHEAVSVGQVLDRVSQFRNIARDANAVLVNSSLMSQEESLFEEDSRRKLFYFIVDQAKAPLN